VIAGKTKVKTASMVRKQSNAIVMPDWHCSFRASGTTRRRDNDESCRSTVWPKSASADFAFIRTTHKSLNEKIVDTTNLCLRTILLVVQRMLTHKLTIPTSDKHFARGDSYPSGRLRRCQV
jgi:hypothetical protein